MNLGAPQIIALMNYLENVHGRMIMCVTEGIGNMALLDQEIDMFMTNYNLPAGTIEQTQTYLSVMLNNLHEGEPA